jgi:hypothetical protein
MSDDLLLRLAEQILQENKKLKGTMAAKYNQGLKAGIRQERERIIKLLVADVCHDWAIQTSYCCDGACRAYNDAIALIKGENVDN